MDYENISYKITCQEQWTKFIDSYYQILYTKLKDTDKSYILHKLLMEKLTSIYYSKDFDEAIMRIRDELYNWNETNCIEICKYIQQQTNISFELLNFTSIKTKIPCLNGSDSDIGIKVATEYMEKIMQIIQNNGFTLIKSNEHEKNYHKKVSTNVFMNESIDIDLTITDIYPNIMIAYANLNTLDDLIKKKISFIKTALRDVDKNHTYYKRFKHILYTASFNGVNTIVFKE